MRKGRVGLLLGLAAGMATVVVALGCGESTAPGRPSGLSSVEDGTGNLSVTISTTGAGIPTGYILDIWGPGGFSGGFLKSVPIGANGTVTLSGLVAGEYLVSFAQPPANCTGTDFHTVTVPAGGTGSTTFSIRCTPIGDLVITTSTTGAGIPQDYALEILRPDRSRYFNHRIRANETLTFPQTPPGGYTVTLGVPTNCTVSGGNRRTVAVPADGAGSTTFSVSCTGPATGDLIVTTSTTGEGIPTGYILDIWGPGGFSGGFLKSVPIGANATVTLSGLVAGEYAVSFAQPPANCTGTDFHTVTVPAGGTGSTTFSVSCTATGT
jgi:hypothetical protein